MQTILKQSLRDYQVEDIQNILTIIKTTDLIPVLMEPPGSGKTFIAAKVIEHLLENGYNRVVFFAEGQTVLKLQNYEEILCSLNPKYKIQMLNAGDDIDYTANVIITLPQTFKNKEPLDIDLLVVDEAHNRYLSTENQEILIKNNINKQLLLTATPSCFLYENDMSPRYKLIGHTFLDLYTKSKQLGEKWFADMRYYIISTPLSFGSVKDIYTDTEELKETLDIPDIDIRITLQEIFETIIKVQFNILNFKFDKLVQIQSDTDWIKHIEVINEFKELKNNLEKTLIVCHNQKAAKYLHNLLIKLGISSVLSCTNEDSDSKNIEYFKQNTSIKCLVVVQRALLGFNYVDLENIVDLSGTLNLNKIYQLFSRLSRRNGKDITKRFYKIGFEEEKIVTAATMELATSLTTHNILKYKTKKNTAKGIISSNKKYLKIAKIAVNKERTQCTNLDILEVFYQLNFEVNSRYTITHYTTLEQICNKYHLNKLSRTFWVKLIINYIQKNTRYPSDNERIEYNGDVYSTTYSRFIRQNSHEFDEFLYNYVNDNNVIRGLNPHTRHKEHLENLKLLNPILDKTFGYLNSQHPLYPSYEAILHTKDRYLIDDIRKSKEEDLKNFLLTHLRNVQRRFCRKDMLKVEDCEILLQVLHKSLRKLNEDYKIQSDNLIESDKGVIYE